MPPLAGAEGKLDSAVAEASQATAQLQQLGTSAQQAAAEAAAAATAAAQAAFEQQKLQLLQQQQQDMQRAAQQQWQQQQQQAAQQQQQAVQQQPPPQAPVPQAPVGGITVVYETGWANAYLHHNAGEHLGLVWGWAGSGLAGEQTCERGQGAFQGFVGLHSSSSCSSSCGDTGARHCGRSDPSSGLPACPPGRRPAGVVPCHRPRAMCAVC